MYRNRTFKNRYPLPQGNRFFASILFSKRDIARFMHDIRYELKAFSEMAFSFLSILESLTRNHGIDREKEQ